MQAFSKCRETHEMREWHEHAWGAGGDLQQASQPKELEECPLELRGAAETFWVPPAHPD